MSKDPKTTRTAVRNHMRGMKITDMREFIRHAWRLYAEKSAKAGRLSA